MALLYRWVRRALNSQTRRFSARAVMAEICGVKGIEIVEPLTPDGFLGKNSSRGRCWHYASCPRSDSYLGIAMDDTR